MATQWFADRTSDYVKRFRALASLTGCVSRPVSHSRGVGGGDGSHMKGDARRLAWAVKFGSRSHLGCSGQNAIIFSHEDLV